MYIYKYKHVKQIMTVHKKMVIMVFTILPRPSTRSLSVKKAIVCDKN